MRPARRQRKDSMRGTARWGEEPQGNPIPAGESDSRNEHANEKVPWGEHANEKVPWGSSYQVVGTFPPGALYD